MPTKIEWTDESWNPIVGVKGKWHCTKISPGCANCYAEVLNIRFGNGIKYTKGADHMRLDVDALKKPLSWRKPRRIFVCSMTDLFHEDVRTIWIQQILHVILACPRHTFQVLTKRSARMLSVMDSLLDRKDPPQNLWLGVSAEDQLRADERIPHLIETPAAVRFLSLEPLLGPINLVEAVPCDWYCKPAKGHVLHPFEGRNRNNPIHWVIAGGESGESGGRARPMQEAWALAVRDQCQAARVPFFFKQWGQWKPYGKNREMVRIKGEKVPRLLDGRLHSEYPKELVPA